MGSDSAHARAFGKDIHLPAVRCAGNSVMFLMCLSFPYPRAICIAWGLWQHREKATRRSCGCTQGKCSAPRAGLRTHGSAGSGCCSERRDFVPVCLLLLAQTWSCITSQSPAHIFTVAQGQGCWLGQRGVKHSSEISGCSFVPWEFVEPQVDAAPAGLQDTSSAQGLTQQDASTS